MAIHPTAIIDESAVIDSSTEIGPNVIIEGDTRIGKRNKIYPGAFICRGTTMGDDNQVHMGAVVGHVTQDKAYRGEKSYLHIGNNNVIREYATIHRGSLSESATTIGNGCLLMGGCHIAHDCQIGNGVIIANMVGLAGYVEVCDRAILSGGTMVHQFVKIGRLSICSGNSRVGMDVPPFTIVAERNEAWGVNVIGLKRAGLSPETIHELRKLHRTFFRSRKARSDVINELKGSPEFSSSESQELITFIEESKRGVCSRSRR